jgi:hypothetical protein
MTRPLRRLRESEGWERRFVADRRRAEEAVALYESMGFEVAAEPFVSDEMDPECADCRLVTLLEFQTIYTRKRKEPAT